jgi:hypothetical protein
MDCPKCQGFLLLEPGPLAFDDYRCINRGKMVRFPSGTLRSDQKLNNKAVISVGGVATSRVDVKHKRMSIPPHKRVAMGLCIQCCARRDGESPRCKACRARVAASVQKCWLKKHPNAKVRVHHQEVA